MRWLPLFGLLPALALSPLASAADITEVNDAGEEGDRIDIDLRALVLLEAQRVEISREGASEPELSYQRRRATLELQTELGLARDFAVFGVLPLVLSETQTLERVGASASLEDEQLLSAALPASVTREGLGDASLGLALGLMNQERDPTRPHFVLRLSAQLPTGEQRQAGTSGVGYGLLGARGELAFSKRLGRLEPYSSLRYTYYQERAADPLFRDLDRGQRSVRPGQEGEARVGLELIAYETKRDRVAIELGGSFGYVSLGRGYTPLFDFMAEPEGSEGATVLHGVDAQGATSDQLPFDGLLEEEQRGTLSGQLGVDARLASRLELRAQLRYQRASAHFLSFGSAGVDTNGDGLVSNEDESNPFFQPEIDSPSARIRADETSALLFVLNAALAF